MSLDEVIREHHRNRQAITDDVEAEGVRLWREIDRDDLSGSWQQSIPRLSVALSAAQRVVAGQADEYADATLRELGADVSPVGRVDPRALSGRSADGRSLTTLLMHPVITAKLGIADGVPSNRALGGGLANLSTILRTEVADAGRVADGVAVAARPSVGYVRRATPPSCPRCAVLAGRVYRYSQGFQRHPGCDCDMVPATEAQARDIATDPKRLFDEGQIRGLSKRDARAIRDGADINRVVNAHRGMYTADGGRRATKALAGSRGIPRLRLRPETIYREATSRAEAINLLRVHGYIH